MIAGDRPMDFLAYSSRDIGCRLVPTWCFGDPACSRYVGPMEPSEWQ